MERLRAGLAAGAAHLQFRRQPVNDVADGHGDDLRAVLQHAARPERHALVRTCGVFRSGRFLCHSCDQSCQQWPAACAADPCATGGRHRWLAVRRALWLCDHAAIRHGVFDDHAGHCRAGICLLTDVPGIFWRRGRRVGQPGLWQAIPRYQLWPSDSGLLSDCFLVVHQHGGDVR